METEKKGLFPPSYRTVRVVIPPIKVSCMVCPRYLWLFKFHSRLLQYSKLNRHMASCLQGLLIFARAHHSSDFVSLLCLTPPAFLCNGDSLIISKEKIKGFFSFIQFAKIICRERESKKGGSQKLYWLVFFCKCHLRSWKENYQAHT